MAFGHRFDPLNGPDSAFDQQLDPSPGAATGTVSVVLRELATPLGAMIAGATESHLCLLELADRPALEHQLRPLARLLHARFVSGHNPLIDELGEALSAYFAGALRRFELPLLSPGTTFQQAVWRRIQGIPYGASWSYGQVAHAMRRPGSARAVARANACNRIAILIPCHRVVSGTGDLAGYGGGLWRKRRLLELERTGA